MMSALEREIMEKFHQLQPAAQQRIRVLIEQETTPEVATTLFDYAGWFHRMDGLRETIRAGQNKALPSLDVVDLLRDIRDGEDE
jgi:hypothetical protein